MPPLNYLYNMGTQAGPIQPQGGPVATGPMLGQSTGGWFGQNAPQNTGVAGGWTPDPTKKNAGIVVDESRKTDPNYIMSVLQQTAQASGNPFNEQQARDYWLPKIQQSGGLSDYWVTRALPDQYGGGALMGGGGGGGFSGADVAAQDPGYQFTQQQAQDAIQRSAAAKGTLLTGGTLKDLAGYTAGLANQTYGNIFNRNLQLANLGYDAAARQANLGSSYGQQAGQDLSGYGNAAAAGSVNQGNIWGNTIGNLGGLYGMYQGGWMQPQGGSSTVGQVPGWQMTGGGGFGDYSQGYGAGPLTGPIPGMATY